MATQKKQTRDSTDSLLTYDEVAERLSVPPKRVYELPIPQVRIGDSTIRWRPSDVDAFIKARRVTMQAAAQQTAA